MIYYLFDILLFPQIDSYEIRRQRHHRRSIRLPNYDYSQPGAYFITIVTFQRDCLFGEIVNGELRLSVMGQIAEEHWRLIPEHFPHAELGAYVVMPNHVHGIIIIHENAACLAPTTTWGKTKIHRRNCWFVQIRCNKTYWSRIERLRHLAKKLL